MRSIRYDRHESTVFKSDIITDDLEVTRVEEHHGDVAKGRAGELDR